MPNRPGFFQLQSPLDLLAKMDADYTRIATDPFDAYAAFDFFVTAEHLPEWLGKVNCSPGPAKTEQGCALEALCKHLANGGKHFNADGRHDAVEGTQVWTPARAGIARAGATRAGDLTGHLMIQLGPEEAAALALPAISTLALAGLVLTYWKAHPAIARVAQLQSATPKD